MFIRCTTIKSKQSGTPYKTYRLVESERVADKVKQRTLLNLGSHFAVPKSQWNLLSARISELLSAQQSLFTVELPADLESLAQRYAAQILASLSTPNNDPGAFESVSVNTLELVRPRRVGIEQLALHAMAQLKLDDRLKALGFNRHQLAAAMGNIVARMAHPASELATHAWLQQRSGLGELIGSNFEAMGLDRLYQVSDLLWKHKAALEDHLYQQETTLFDTVKSEGLKGKAVQNKANGGASRPDNQTPSNPTLRSGLDNPCYGRENITVSHSLVNHYKVIRSISKSNKPKSSKRYKSCNNHWTIWRQLCKTLANIYNAQPGNGLPAEKTRTGMPGNSCRRRPSKKKVITSR